MNSSAAAVPLNSPDELASVARVAPRKAARARYTFTIPDTIGGEIRTLTLIALKAGEELQATKRSRGEISAIGYEMARACLVAVNGQPVSVGDGTADKAFEEMDPKVRSLLLQAFNHIHSPREEDRDSFLGSMHTQA